MIGLDEIQTVSAELGVNASNVQRDYVFGWLIAGIFGDSNLRNNLVLKGGNALRKGYFPVTRYSDDLDFSSARGVDASDLLERLNVVCRSAEGMSGVKFDVKRNRITEVRSVDNQRSVAKFKLYFHDFTGTADYLTLAVRVDVTDFDRLVLPTQRRQLIHRYSDAARCNAEIVCVALEEALADKLKCLLQRRYSHDLFDFVHGVFINDELLVDRRLVVSTFLRKTIFEPSPVAALRLLLGTPFEGMRSFWGDVVCPRVSALGFDGAVNAFRSGIDSLFQTFRGGDQMAGAYFPAELRNPILQAGSERKLLELKYHGATRLVEPYALSFKRPQFRPPREYLYAWDRTGGRSGQIGLKSFVQTDVESLKVTDQEFAPQYEVLLSKAGDRDPSEGFGRPFVSSRPRTAVSAKPAFWLRCSYCGKRFRRTKRTRMLNRHGDGYGNPCYGRMGDWLN